MLTYGFLGSVDAGVTKVSVIPHDYSLS